MKWFTSDTHFGHERIIELSNRPFRDVAHMNETIIDNWNSVVKPTDEIFHLGDVALGPWVEWDGVLTRLNGFKTLVVGNHDRVFKGMSQKQNDKFAEHYARWFDVVTDEVVGLPIGGHITNLSHFPYSGDSHGAERYREFRLEDKGRTLIHGHTHENNVISRSDAGTLQVHVGMDAWNFYPVPEGAVASLITANV